MLSLQLAELAIEFIGDGDETRGECLPRHDSCARQNDDAAPPQIVPLILSEPGRNRFLLAPFCGKPSTRNPPQQQSH